MADDSRTEHITAREFDGFKTAIVNAIAQSDDNTNKRFDTIERRFDTAQKTTNDLLRIAGSQGQKLEEHERRLNSGIHKHSRKDDPPTDNDPITVKDVKRALFFCGLFISVLTGIVKGLPMVLKAIQP